MVILHACSAEKKIPFFSIEGWLETRVLEKKARGLYTSSWGEA